MRRMAGSVSIVAAGSKGARCGLTATSIASLSLDPPALVVCIRRSSATYAALASERRFSVNLLHASQAEHAATFSSMEVGGEQRFTRGDWVESRGAPALRGANAVVFCELEDQLAFGTHVAIVGRVSHVLLGDDIESAPLLYFDGAYRAMSPRRGQ
jgi:flavin reductase (DIM6/NTAB) family NADH-FMN oxidoreductase RutF